MAFRQTNQLRTKKKDIQDNISELPKSIATAQSLIDEIFSIFDSIGKNLVNLAIFNVDPDILDKFDRDFKSYGSKKSEISSILGDISRLGSSLKEIDFGSSNGSVINETVIDDLQTILSNINETIGSDISTKLEELKVLKNELASINTQVKQPVDQINESLQVFQKTTDVSFEIFTKSMLESLKNSVEMRSISENLESMLFDLEDLTQKIPASVQQSLKEEIRSVVSESIGNFDVRMQKVLDEKLKDIKNKLNADQSSMIDQKFDHIFEALARKQAEPAKKEFKADEPGSRDMREINIFLKYLYEWPTGKDDIIKKIEDFRDTLLVKRINDPPFRVTATNIFRESISELSREEKFINQDKLREIIQLFENLKRTIESTEG